MPQALLGAELPALLAVRPPWRQSAELLIQMDARVAAALPQSGAPRLASAAAIAALRAYIAP